MFARTLSKNMQGWLSWKRPFKNFFFFFLNRESKKPRNNNLNGTLLVCTGPWFGRFGHFNWAIKSNSQKRHQVFKGLIPLSSQRAEINVYYGTVPGTWSFLVNTAPGKKRTIVNLLTHFPLAVSLNPVTQFERILEQTECRVEMNHKSLFHESFAYHRVCVMKWSTVCPWVLIHYIHIKKTILQPELCRLSDAASIWQEGESSLPKPASSIYPRGPKPRQGSRRRDIKPICFFAEKNIWGCYWCA